MYRTYKCKQALCHYDIENINAIQYPKHISISCIKFYVCVSLISSSIWEETSSKSIYNPVYNTCTLL